MICRGFSEFIVCQDRLSVWQILLQKKLILHILEGKVSVCISAFVVYLFVVLKHIGQCFILSYMYSVSETTVAGV